MYEALTVAEYIIWYLGQHNKTVNNLRLQKLLYFIQAEFLVSKKLPCFGERIEALDWGPVVPSVHEHYRKWAALSLSVPKDVHFYIDEQDVKMINGIVDACDKYSTAALLEIIRGQTPWIDAYHSVSKVITHESLRRYFDYEAVEENRGDCYA